MNENKKEQVNDFLKSIYVILTVFLLIYSCIDAINIIKYIVPTLLTNNFQLYLYLDCCIFLLEVISTFCFCKKFTFFESKYFFYLKILKFIIMIPVCFNTKINEDNHLRELCETYYTTNILSFISIELIKTYTKN